MALHISYSYLIFIVTANFHHNGTCRTPNRFHAHRREQIVAPAGDDRQPWLHDVQECRTRGAAASVMRDLQHMMELFSRLKPDYRLKPGKEERPLLARAALHAESLELTHPVTKEAVTIKAELPKDLKVALKYLRQFAI